MQEEMRRIRLFLLMAGRAEFMSFMLLALPFPFLSFPVRFFPVSMDAGLSYGCRIGPCIPCLWFLAKGDEVILATTS